MQIKQIFTGAIWYGIVPRITMVVGFLLLPLMTPYLTPFDYGIYGLLFSYSSFILVISTLGLSFLFTNSFFTYKDHFRKVWGRLYFLILVLGILWAMIYAVVMSFVVTDIGGWSKAIAIILASVPIGFAANTIIAQSYYQLTYRPKSLIIRTLSSNVLGILVSFIVIYYFRMGYVGWLLGGALTSITAFVFFIPALWKKEKIIPNPIINWRRLKKWLRVSLPVVPHSLGGILLSNSDRIIMSVLAVSIADIGLYSNGYQMGSYANVISMAIFTSIAPRIQELYREGNFLKLRKLFMFCQLIVVFISVTLAIWMPQIYQLLIRNIDLQQANVTATIICFSSIAYPFYVFIATPVYVEEKTKKLLWLIFIPSILNVVLNFIYIPIYGYKAAAYTTLIAYWSQLLIPYCIKYYKNETKKLYGNLWFPLIFLLMIIVLFFGTEYFLVKLDVMYKILITTGAIFLLCVYIYKKKSETF